jgi:hypothetical protein
MLPVCDRVLQMVQFPMFESLEGSRPAAKWIGIKRSRRETKPKVVTEGCESVWQQRVRGCRVICDFGAGAGTRVCVPPGGLGTRETHRGDAARQEVRPIAG